MSIERRGESGKFNQKQGYLVVFGVLLRFVFGRDQGKKCGPEKRD